MAAIPAACASSTEPKSCARSGAMELGRGHCLVFQDGGVLDAHRSTIVEVVTQTLGQTEALLPVESVEILVFASAQRSIPGYGLGGYTPSADRIDLIFDPGFQDLNGVIGSRLPGVLAHELHHAARWGTVGYGTTLLEAVVSEGLADHFALEVTFGSPPPWSLALDQQELERWMATARESWTDPGYQHSRWFFGDGVVPRWTGYALGFVLVGDYLTQDPSRTAAGLIAEPARRFVP